MVWYGDFHSWGPCGTFNLHCLQLNWTTSDSRAHGIQGTVPACTLSACTTQGHDGECATFSLEFFMVCFEWTFFHRLPESDTELETAQHKGKCSSDLIYRGKYIQHRSAGEKVRKVLTGTSAANRILSRLTFSRPGWGVRWRGITRQEPSNKTVSHWIIEPANVRHLRRPQTRYQTAETNVIHDVEQRMYRVSLLSYETN